MENNLTKTTKKMIESQSNEMPANIVSRLKQARQSALQNRKKSFFYTAWCIPVTAVAVFAMYFMYTAINLDNSEQYNPDIDIALIQQMDLIEQLDLAEDLDFYQWLDIKDELSSI